MKRPSSDNLKTGAKRLEEKQAIELFLRTRTEESFCALFEYLYARMRRYFLLRGLESSIAEELAQDVMFIVYRRAGDIRDQELFHGWIFKIAKNELLRHWRRERTRNEIAAFEPLSEDLAYNLTTEFESARVMDFTKWLSYLEPADRELIILRFVEELSYEDLSAALGIPLGTVKWRIFNVKKKLSTIINTSSPGGTARRRN
jgi:RNA polymerase sigma-70 factor, ECF subfamily